MNKANETITVWWTRLSFPTLWTPKPIVINGRPQGDPKYSAGLVIPASQADTVKAVQDAEKRVIAKAWPDGNVPQDFHHAMTWGPTARPKDSSLADAWLINAYSAQNSRPQVGEKDPSGRWIDYDPEADQAKVYSGCEAHVVLGLFSYQTTATKGGIGAGLNIVWLTGRQFGRFDGRPTADTAFGDGPTVAAPPAPEGQPPAPTEQPGGNGATQPVNLPF